MPAKDDLQLEPSRLGLSETDILYLLIFRELHNQPASPSDIYEVVRTELKTINRGRSRSYLYKVVSHMETYGWIKTTIIKDKKNKKYYTITEDGLSKIDSFRESCLNSIETLNSMADNFVYHITGIGNVDSSLIVIKPQQKMFSRLINVRYLIRFLFLKILTEPEHQSETGKNIWYILSDRYQWQPAQGYFYELAHEMERDLGYIQGTWTTSRRNSYVYRLTDRGVDGIKREADLALPYIRELQKYTHYILRLFPEHYQSS